MSGRRRGVPAEAERERRGLLHEGSSGVPNYCCQYLGQFNYLVITRRQTDRVAYTLRQAANAYMHVHKLHL